VDVAALGVDVMVMRAASVAVAEAGRSATLVVVD
jgi:hypothetical protein